MKGIEFKRTSSSSPDFQALVNLLDAELKNIDGDEHDFYMQYNKIENLKHVVVAYIAPAHPLPQDEGRVIPVACGAFKKLSHDSVEVKRMYTDTGFRGKRIGKEVLAELERWAGELNYRYIILETGKRQSAAVALYRSSGYEVIANYGQYEGIENSICFRKEL